MSPPTQTHPARLFRLGTSFQTPNESRSELGEGEQSSPQSLLPFSARLHPESVQMLLMALLAQGPAHTLQMAVRQVRTSRSGSVRRFQAATLRPRIITRRMSRGDACSCEHCKQLRDKHACSPLSCRTSLIHARTQATDGHNLSDPLSGWLCEAEPKAICSEEAMQKGETLPQCLRPLQARQRLRQL